MISSQAKNKEGNHMILEDRDPVLLKDVGRPYERVHAKNNLG